MTQLRLVENTVIPIYRNGNDDEAVNARELHERLESKRDFSEWIKYRIKQCQLIEGEDFILLPKSGEQTDEVFTKNVENLKGGHNRKEYIVTLDAAKEIAMLEQNSQGKKVRQYFIQYEKRAKKELKKQAKIDWQAARIAGKQQRKELMDVVSQFVQYAKAQGSRRYEMYFSNVTQMTYVCLEFIQKHTQKAEGLREMLDSAELSALAFAEAVAEEAFIKGMEQGLPYKDVFQAAKQEVDAFAKSALPTIHRKKSRLTSQAVPMLAGGVS